jgi:DNA-binding NarL/FixJ family response regulator
VPNQAVDDSVTIHPPPAPGVRTIYVVDPHPIYRRGIEICIKGLPRVAGVSGSGSRAEAWNDPALRAADLAIVDASGPEGAEFIRALCDELGVPVILCCSVCDEETILAAVEAGATGILAKDALTPEKLCVTVEAVLEGAGVMSADLLARLLSGLNRVSREVLEPRGLSLSRLTPRERDVLKLVAEGRATREVALELSYSERTIKNVLHDVITKLGVRSRAHAVAYALRHGLI